MSLTFLICFSLALSIPYYLCSLRFRWILLLLSSLACYAYCGLSAVPFLLITALSTWAGSLLISSIGDRHKAWLKANKASLSSEEKKQAKKQNRRKQRTVFLCVLLLNFGMLGIFKYSDSFLSLAGALSHRALPTLNLLLPLGISFYTFQSTGYLMDIYNGKYSPERNPLKYLLYVSFFPQLIQGPIARFDQLGGQFTEEHRFDIDQFERGLLLMLWGFFKKRVIADRALPLIETVFSNSPAYGGAVTVVAVLFYSLQQYCDFSGGIDLVTGIAELYGIRLAPNFRRPYFSISLTDFWHRWHISLGNWMRDYVFYPFALSRPATLLGKKLKGNHPQLARTLPAAIGNILVFLLVGIWHGLQMNYVLWGLYNGCILAVTALADPYYKAFSEQHTDLVRSRGFHLFRILRTFLVVNIGWYFDRALNAGDAFRMLAKTFTDPAFSQIQSGTLMTLGLTERDFSILLISTLILFTVSVLGERGKDVRGLVLSRPLPVRWLILFVFLYMTVAWFVSSSTSPASFLYAMF